MAFPSSHVFYFFQLIINIHYQLLRIMLSSISIFPNYQFLRMGGNEAINHSCGGLASLIIIFLLVVLFSIKFSEVVKMETIFFNTHSQVFFEPELIPLMTHTDDKEIAPFMFAVIPRENQFCVSHNITVASEHQTITGGKGGTDIKKDIPMVTCTEQHFQFAPDIKQRLTQKDLLSKMLCLPLNQTYNVQGSYSFSELYQSLNLKIRCGSSCDGLHCGSVQIYELRTKVNPSQKQPLAYYLSKRMYDILVNKREAYEVLIDKVVLQTDNTIWPLQNKQTTIAPSITETPVSLRYDINATQGKITLYYRSSGETITTKRHFLKLLEVFSYVGGFVPTLIGCFFFMNAVGAYFYEMGFAQIYFRNKEAKERGFIDFLKYQFYRIGRVFNIDMIWPVPQKQKEIRQSVNKVLNVSYLFQRIDFLQRALSILFERHHLKGLYLIHKATVETANDAYKSNYYRDGIVKFLHVKRSRGQRRREKLESKKNLLKLNCNESNPKSSALVSSVRNLQMNREITDENLTQSQNLEKTPYPSINMITNKVSKIQQIKKLQKLKASEHIYFDQMTEELEKIEGKEENAIEVDAEAMVELRQDFRRLREEAVAHSEDKRSKRIYEGIDLWLKGIMELEIEKQKEKTLFLFKEQMM